MSTHDDARRMMEEGARLEAEGRREIYLSKKQLAFVEAFEYANGELAEKLREAIQDAERDYQTIKNW